MNATVRENPSLMPRLQGDINRLFGNAQQTDTSSSATATWVPAVDIREYPDRFELYVDVPGVETSAVDLTLEDSVLTLSGERSAKGPGNGNGELVPQYQRIERSQGRFYRRFVLPDMVDSEKVNASGKDGVLRVIIPKLPKSMPRRIQIDA